MSTFVLYVYIYLGVCNFVLISLSFCKYLLHWFFLPYLWLIYVSWGLFTYTYVCVSEFQWMSVMSMCMYVYLSVFFCVSLSVSGIRLPTTHLRFVFSTRFGNRILLPSPVLFHSRIHTSRFVNLKLGQGRPWMTTCSFAYAIHATSWGGVACLLRPVSCTRSFFPMYIPHHTRMRTPVHAHAPARIHRHTHTYPATHSNHNISLLVIVMCPAQLRPVIG